MFALHLHPLSFTHLQVSCIPETQMSQILADRFKQEEDQKVRPEFLLSRFYTVVLGHCRFSECKLQSFPIQNVGLHMIMFINRSLVLWTDVQQAGNKWELRTFRESLVPL